MSSRAGGARALLVVVIAVAVYAGAGCITHRILVEGTAESGDGADAPLVANPAELRRVEAETAQIRRLPFLEQVPADVMTVDELGAWFDRYADVHKAALAREDRFFHRTGILPPTVSTAEAYKGFIADFVGGVYDDGRGRMILVSDYAAWAKLQQDVVGVLTGVDWAYELFLAHELDHALQDQHFALDEMLRGGVYEDNDDAAYVRKTLLESEANVVGMAHFLGMDLEQLATRKAFFLFLRYNNLLNGPLMRVLAGRTPSFFARQSLAQYELGLSFVERKLDEGGMAELSRAYVRQPGTKGAVPESTEQLLWPRKMRPESIDRPVPMARLEAAPASLPGSSVVLTNVFGALAFRHWLETLRGALEAAAVADGWGGDRWDLLDDGGESVLLWRTTWDSEDDARQFFSAYASAVPTRYGPRAARTDGLDDALTAEGAERAVFVVPAAPDEKRFIRTRREERVHVERRGRDVLVVDGARPDVAEALAREGWSLLVRAPEPLVDLDRLHDKARALEENIQQAPPLPPRPDLLGRLFLPARTMALRLGSGLAVDAQVPDHVDGRGLFPVADAELRWGFRPHLELSLPFALAGEVRTPLGQTVVGASLSSLFPSSRFALRASQAVPVGERLVVAAQGALEEVGGAQTATRLAAGALLQPLDEVVLAPAVARIVDDEPYPLVVLGAALRRGVAVQPLVELEVLDGLFAYESSALLFEERERGLRFIAHSHVLGLLLYF